MTSSMLINHMNRCFAQNLKNPSTTTISSRLVVRLCSSNPFEYVATSRFLHNQWDRTVKDLFHRLRRQVSFNNGVHTTIFKSKLKHKFCHTTQHSFNVVL